LNIRIILDIAQPDLMAAKSLLPILVEPGTLHKLDITRWDTPQMVVDRTVN